MAALGSGSLWRAVTSQVQEMLAGWWSCLGVSKGLRLMGHDCPTGVCLCKHVKVSRWV